MKNPFGRKKRNLLKLWAMHQSETLPEWFPDQYQWREVTKFLMSIENLESRLSWFVVKDKALTKSLLQEATLGKCSTFPLCCRVQKFSRL